jgi:hypothetical protein
MRIRRKFLQLTSQTVPFGTEIKIQKFLPKDIKKDIHGNYYMTIGDNFSTMFTCHLDTACKYQKRVNHRQTTNLISTDGTTILGADDKAGMVVLLYMIEKKVPGLYYFFIGEEVGCVGSSKLSTNFDWPNITKVVSFDRRGTNSIITEQLFGRCCSDEFAQELANRLNDTGMYLEMEPDDTGILTDSAQFVHLVGECTNISVGYYNEHTTEECQDIEFLSRLCQAVVKIDWETLPIVRQPGEDDIDDIWDDDDDDFDTSWTSEGGTYLSEEFSERFHTTIYEKGEYKKMYVSKNHIKSELESITNLLKKQGYNPTEVSWDGTNCYVLENEGIFQFIGNRTDLINFIPELQYIPYQEMRENLYRVDNNWSEFNESYAN